MPKINQDLKRNGQNNNWNKKTNGTEFKVHYLTTTKMRDPNEVVMLVTMRVMPTAYCV